MTEREQGTYLTPDKLQDINEWSFHHLDHERYVDIQCLLEAVKARLVVKEEKEIRQMMKIVEFFGHPKAVEALQWVLGEYPPASAAMRGKRATDAVGTL